MRNKLLVFLSLFSLLPGCSDPADSQYLHFTLQSAAGPVSLDDSAGRLRVIYIGYMSCPDVCPTSLARLGGALHQLNDVELAAIQPMFISVDPERDTVENLALYSSYFHPSLLGLTGERSEIDQVVNFLQAFYRKVLLEGSTFNYSVDHSSNLYLLDAEGQLVETLPDSLTPDELAARLRAYL